MADTAIALFHRTAHFDWTSLRAEHGPAAVIDYRRFLTVKVFDGDLGVGAVLRQGPNLTSTEFGTRTCPCRRTTQLYPLLTDRFARGAGGPQPGDCVVF